MTSELAEFIDGLLIESLPDSLKESLMDAMTSGVPREKILARAARIAGQDSLTYLAVWAYLEAEGGGPLPEGIRPKPYQVGWFEKL